MNTALAIVLIVAALIVGVIIGIMYSVTRYAKNVFPAGDWTAIDPSNISIQNPKDIHHWHERKRLMFEVVNTKYKPGMEK